LEGIKLHIGLIIFVVIAIILWAVLKNKMENENGETNNKNSGKETVEKKETMKELFYKNIRNGEKPYKLMNIFNQFDLMFIKSLFQNEAIAYYIEGEYVSKIHPGMQIGSFGKVDFYILEKDYDNAIKIIQEYINNTRLQS
jgi:quinol-cytochrome oxidoreductase complex cytochrome b subunit